MSVSRRSFLAASGAALVASSFRTSRSRANQTTPFVRRSLLDPQIGPVLDSYRKAITALLQLPPDNARNWYRIAFIHELDCPHHNWWFLPWHRGYLGWFEQICRDASGDQNFALPYWDWTATPELPAPFGDNSVLNPSNPPFIGPLADFQTQFTNPVATLYQGFNQNQLAQLQPRGLPDATAFVNQITGDFAAAPFARQSDFGGSFPTTVSIDTIHQALNATTFETFASLPATSHQDGPGEGVLESQPHDNVHGAVGGFMGAFLSPVDPLFYMHHSNIDRLWDVWTRKQQQINQPTLPQGTGLQTWQNEPFLFYVDRQGNAMTQGANATAGNYATIGQFNYNYTPGSGEDVVTTAASPVAPTFGVLSSTLTRNMVDFQQPTWGSASVPAGTAQTIGVRGGRQIVARIALELPPQHQGMKFNVLVNPPQGATSVGFRDPSFAGTISPFGMHRGAHMAAAVSFDVPLNRSLEKLAAAKRWSENQPIRVQVVPAVHGVAVTPFSVPLKSIEIVNH